MIYVSILPFPGYKHPRNLSFQNRASLRAAKPFNEESGREDGECPIEQMKNEIHHRRKTMKKIHLVIAVAGAMVLSAMADPFNAPFLQVDINCGDDPNSATQPGFVGWSFPAFTGPSSDQGEQFTNYPGIPLPGAYPWPYQPQVTTNEWTMVFYPTNFININQYTPTGPITVTLMATNWNPTNDYAAWDPIGMEWAPWNTMTLVGATNFGNGTVGEVWSNLYSDFVYVQHSSNLGYGWDYISLTFSNLTPNTNYEITVWCYDPSAYPNYNADYVAWGPTNPSTMTIVTNAASPNGTNVPMFANYVPQPGGGGTIPKLARVLATGPNPSIQDPGDPEYAYSASFYMQSDNSGTITVYAWEDDDAAVGTQLVPLNAFAIGQAYMCTCPYPFPPTNAIPWLDAPVPAAYGPPTVWPYTTGGLNIPSGGSYTDQSFENLPGAILGETFKAPRDFMLRNFYIACGGTTNSGNYALLLYDLGTNSAPASFNPSANTNVLGHPYAGFDLSYWSFSPNSLATTNNFTHRIVKFKLPKSGDQVYLTNKHNYFLGFQYVGGWKDSSNNVHYSNDMVWESASGQTYTNGTAYAGNTNGVTSIGSVNFVMAADVLQPNLGFVNIYSYPLQTNDNGSGFPATTNWPGSPVVATFQDPYSWRHKHYVAGPGLYVLAVR
jgi:hypothetical protein